MPYERMDRPIRFAVRLAAAALLLGLLSWALAIALPAPAGKTVRLRPISDKPYLYDVVETALYRANPRKYKEWGEFLEIDYKVFAAEADLDGDGVNEVIVRFPRRCRADGCFMFVLQNISGNWTERCSVLEPEVGMWIVVKQMNHGQKRITPLTVAWNDDIEQGSTAYPTIRWLPDGQCQQMPNSTIGVRPIDGH